MTWFGRFTGQHIYCPMSILNLEILELDEFEAIGNIPNGNSPRRQKNTGTDHSWRAVFPILARNYLIAPEKVPLKPAP